MKIMSKNECRHSSYFTYVRNSTKLTLNICIYKYIEIYLSCALKFKRRNKKKKSKLIMCNQKKKKKKRDKGSMFVLL